MIPQELHALVPKLVKLSRDYENGRCLFVCTEALQIRSVGIHVWIGARDRNITIFEDEKQTTKHPEAKIPWKKSTVHRQGRTSRAKYHQFQC
jgi:hypothetical protein